MKIGQNLVFDTMIRIAQRHLLVLAVLLYIIVKFSFLLSSKDKGEMVIFLRQFFVKILLNNFVVCSWLFNS